MNKKPTFNTTSLDQLINESVADADQFKNQLQTVNATGADLDFANAEIQDDYLPDEDKTFAEKKDALNNETGDSISYNYVYRKIGDLVDTGNTSLQMLQSIDPDVTDSKLLVAAATLMNAIRGCLSEYTKIHQQWVRFQQTLKFEEIKQNNKKEIIEYRKAVATGQLDKKADAAQLYELSSTDLIEFLQWKKEKEAAEKEKNEKM